MSIDIVNYIWPWLAVWLAGLWVAIWQGILAKASMEVMWKKSELNSFYLTITILWIALIESAVIYWFIVAFQILNIADFSLMASIWAWLAIWLTWLWAWIWEWKLVAWAIRAIDRDPEMKWKIMTFMVLFIALVESAAIYGLVIAFKIIGADDPTLANSFVWMWLAIWLAGLWVAIWMWILADKSMEIIGKKPKLISLFLTITILGIALVESAAIYWLIVSFEIFAKWLDLYASLWAWLAIWLAGLWAWIWEWILISGALATIEKKPELKWKMITFMVLFIALVESAAIYWLVVAFKIMWADDVSTWSLVWMWLSIWLAGLWVAIWMWILAKKSMKAMWNKPEFSSLFLTITILGIALVESAAIYWLIVSFEIFNRDLWLMASIGAWLAIWLTGLWVWIWEWKLISWAIETIEKKPELKWKMITFMVLFVALVESAAIYWLVIAFKILWADDVSLWTLIWMWFSIWLAGLWVAIWMWILAEKSMKAMWNKPEFSNLFLTITILGIALVESAAIYWLIVSFEIFNKDLWLMASVWAWLAIWLAWLWAWIWEWKLISWAIETIEKRPELKWKIITFMVLFVALVESSAIYWLVVAFKILWAEEVSFDSLIWMWMAIWFAGLWVAIWMWILAEKSMKAIWRRPELSSLFLTITILGIALVESAAIYGLVVAFQIFSDNLSFYASLWAWLAIWLAWLWAWIWEWILISGALASLERNPELKWKMITFMVLFVALVEVTAIYGLIVAFQIMWASWPDTMIYLWAWLAIGIAGIWVAIWRWYLAEEAIIIMWKNSKSINFLLTVSILWVALVESAAIYALIVSFQILTIEGLSIYASLWAWLAIWLAWAWVWIWEWLLIKWAMKGINVAPETKGKTLAFMVLFVALIEVVAIYWLIIAFKVAWS